MVVRTARRGRLDPVEIRLRPPQLRVFHCQKRFKIVVAGRRFGKTYLARSEIFDKACGLNGSINWYIAPTYRQAKDLMWRPLKELVPRPYIREKNETGLELMLRNRSLIQLRGADNPDSLRGPGLNHATLDECAFQKKYVWEVVRPMLSDKEGSATFITTPQGFDWVYDLVQDAIGDEEWESFHFTTADGGNVSLAEIEKARAQLDPRMFAQEYLASFENLAGRVYYTFDMDFNVSDEAVDDTSRELRIGMDFNIDPMSAVLYTRDGAYCNVFDEIEIPNADTEIMCQEIRRRYPNRTIYVFPDPQGHQRHTNAPVGETDLTILRRYGFSVMAPNSSYSVVDKINMTNAALCNADGVRRVRINKKCKSLRKGLNGLTYKEGTKLPDKTLGLDHITDAFAYAMAYEYPIAGVTRILQVTGV